MKNILLLLGLGLMFSGCNLFRSVDPEDEKTAIREVFQANQAAIQSGDLEAVKKTLTGEKHADMDGPAAAENLELAKSLSPNEPKIGEVQLQDDKATLTVSGENEGMKMEGKVFFVKVGSDWLIENIEWNIKMDAMEEEVESAKPVEKAVKRPEAFSSLVGKWSGKEGKTGTAKIKFTFSDPFRMKMEKSDGYWIEANVLIRDDIDADPNNGFLMVPSGWSVIDYEVISSSDSSQIQQVSTGAFIDRANNRLGLCVSKPGEKKRNFNWKTPAEGHSCYQVWKEKN